MKTLETIEGKILRMPDHKAARFVEAGTGKYVPKSRWKKEIRDIIAMVPDVGFNINTGEMELKESKSDRIKRQRKERQKS